MPLPQGFREWLAKESQLWHEQGLLQPGQRDQILARYPEEPEGTSRMAFVLRAFGVLLLGAALLLVIGHNWDDLSRTGRLLTVVAGLVGLQGVGLWYLHRDSRQGSVLGALAGCIMFGAAIALTGQIYHLDAHAPDAFLAWCLGSLPFAILLDSSLLYIGCLLLAGTWLSAEASQSVFGFWPYRGADPRPMFFLLIAPVALAAYRRCRPLLAGAVAWALVFAWFWRGDLSAQYLLLPLIIASLHEVGDARARGWRFIGGIGAAVATIAIGTIRAPLASRLFHADSVSCWLILAGAALALGLAIRSRQTLRIWPAGIALVTLLMCLLHGYIDPKSRDGFQVMMIATGNVATILLSVWLIRLGLTEGRLRPYVYGSLVFLVWLIVRYVDISKDLGMLTMAGFFAVLGVILFILARIWKTQREEHQPEVSPDYHPAWLEAIITTAFPIRRALLWTAIALQASTIGWMVWNYHQPAAYGEPVLLRCGPVDPRDLLKGEYVILSYDFSAPTEAQRTALLAEFTALSPQKSAKMSANTMYWNLPADTEVFVPLRRNDVGLGIPGDPTLIRPTQGLYLRGLSRGGQLRFGIEAYYVQEGAGQKWEAERRQGSLVAEIGVLADGRAGLISLKAAPKVALTSAEFRPLERFVPNTNAASKKPGDFVNRPEPMVIADAQAFAQAYVPATKDGKPASTPDFIHELVLSYSFKNGTSGMSAHFTKVERDGGTLVATVQTNYGTKVAAAPAAIVVVRQGVETVEFRDPNGRLLHRDTVK